MPRSTWRATNRTSGLRNAERQQLEAEPGNHPLTMTYAKALMKNQQPHVAEEVLLEQSQRAPQRPGAVVPAGRGAGTVRQYRGLHQSRAEYFILNGALDQAETPAELRPQGSDGWISSPPREINQR